jgi:hypothetical protein
MARETFKDIELGKRKWRVSKVDALSGSNILRRFMASNTTDPQKFLGTLPDEDFQTVQKQLLVNCQEIVKDSPLQVMMHDGRIGVGEISGDVLYMLTVAALSYNLSGFFDEGVLREFHEITRGLVSSNAPT